VVARAALPEQAGSRQQPVGRVRERAWVPQGALFAWARDQAPWDARAWVKDSEGAAWVLWQKGKR